MEDIIKNGQELNKTWIENHPNHWLVKTYEILHNKSIIFSSTSCEITAMMIQWRLNLHFDLNEDSLENITKKHNIFQISIGEDCFNNEHLFTIYNNDIIQSYYKKYTIKKTVLTSTILNAINNINEPGSYEIITSIPSTRTDLNVYYWTVQL